MAGLIWILRMDDDPWSRRLVLPVISFESQLWTLMPMLMLMLMMLVASLE